jgi:hypothetical protein
LHRETFLQGKLLMRNTMIRNRLILLVAFMALCFAGSQSAMAALYDVDCGMSNSPLMSGAAVLGSAGDIWNAYNAGSWTWGPHNVVPLADSTGAASTVTMDCWNYVTGSDNAGGTLANPMALMEDYIAAYESGDGFPVKVQLSGLPVSTAFDLVVYSAGDGANQGGTITLFDPSGNIVKATSGASRDITAGEGIAYQSFAGTTDANGGVYFEVGSTTTWHALNGLQINVVPEPSTFVLLAIGGAMLLVVRKRR